MRNASKIILLVAGIASIITAITLLIVGIVFIAFTTPSSKDAIIEGLKNGSITTSFPGTYEEQATSIQMVFLVLSVIFFIWTALCIVNAVVSFIGRNNQSKTMLITNIVLGVISCIEINLVGAIFGLIANTREKNIENE